MLTDDLLALVESKTIPHHLTGVADIELILRDHFHHDFTMRGVRIPQNIDDETKQYIHRLIRARRSRIDDASRRAKMHQNEDYKRKRNDWYMDRHSKRREEADNSVEKLAWFNVTYLFANLTRRNLTCTLTREEALQLSVIPCHYCLSVMSGGIDRVSSKHNYTHDNVVSCCSDCNYMKGTLEQADFYRYCMDVKMFFEHSLASTDNEKRAKTVHGFKNYCENIARHDVSINESHYNILLSSSCAYCGLANARGIDRVDNSGIYALDNCVSCCKVCNTMKGSQGRDDFIARVLKVCEVNK